MYHQQKQHALPLYDLPDRFESLGRRRRLRRLDINPDAIVVPSTTKVQEEEATTEPEFVC